MKPRRRNDPRRTPEAAANAAREARDRHDAHVLHRLQQDLNDLDPTLTAEKEDTQ
ncbi:hypothetical protein ACWGCW_00535 [Streptomyces sp. NPDC054933]